MEYIEIEQKIHAIFDSLKSELKLQGAVDDSGHAVDVDTFNRVIDEKIKELNALTPMIADKYGVTKDRYMANIFFHNMQLLNEMKKSHMLNYEPNLPAEDPYIAQTQETSKKSIFVNAIRKLMKRNTDKTKTITNSR